MTPPGGLGPKRERTVTVVGAGSPRAAAPAGGLARVAAWLAARTGWRRLVLAAAFGALSVLALPPVFAVPLLVPAFTGLLWQLDGVGSRRGAFALGWAFGAGHFAIGLYWIGIAFLVEAEVYGWMMPFAVAGLAGGLAIFPGLATLAAWRVARQGAGPPDRIAGVLAFALAWAALAWVRGHVLTGFPWNLLATAWMPLESLLQVTALVGAWGLSLLTVLAAAAPATLAPPTGAQMSGRARRALPLAAAGLLLAVAAGGAGRLALAPAPGDDTVPGVRLRIVQPNIPQRMKWDSAQRLDILKRYLALTRRPGQGAATHVIWPETALPMFLSRTEDLRAVLATVAPAGGALLTGLPRVEAPEAQAAGADGADRPRLFNALFALGSGGRTVARYDKAHLVPFGEYVPFADWLPLDKLTPGRIGFTAGPGPRTLDIPGAPAVSPLICYEAIFPGAVTAPERRPGWLLNVTNDAWFGDSSGPYQHLASARLRAVEEGLPLVRAANTGVSVVVDSYGRVRARAGLGTQAVIDSALPRALARPTLYARLGDSGFAVLLLLLGAGLVAWCRRR